MNNQAQSNLESLLFGDIIQGFPRFCLERWQSIHETSARILLSESGLEPLTLSELEELGVPIGDVKKLPLGYGWTRGSPEVRKSILSLYKAELSIDNVVVTNGSAEANLAGILSLVKQGDTVIVDLPTYMQVPGILKWINARVIELKRTPPNWGFPLDKAIQLIYEEEPKLVFITDPNNPTGTYMRRREIEELIEAAEENNTRLFFDEVYWGSEQKEYRPSAVELGSVETVTIVHGLSKVYGLPGLRIGWIVTSREHVEKAWSVKDYTSISPSLISDYVTSKLLANPDAVDALRIRARDIVKENIDAMKWELEDVEGKVIPYWPEAGAYMLLGTLGRSSLEISKQLYYNHGILVNPGECFELPGYLRIGLGSNPSRFKEEVVELVHALSNML